MPERFGLSALSRKAGGRHKGRSYSEAFGTLRSSVPGLCFQVSPPHPSGLRPATLSKQERAYDGDSTADISHEKLYHKIVKMSTPFTATNYT